MLPKILSQDSNYDFYRSNLKWTDSFVKKNINIIENNYRKYPHRNRWNCNCHVIHDNDYDIEHIDFKLLRNEYEKVVLNFCKKRNLKLSHISDIWYNYYKLGQYQEPHIHEGNGYTVVHYMIFDKKHHEPTKFTNPKIKSPNINQGDILFFPANLEHYVPENKTSIPRLTTAFTIVLI